MTRQATRRFGPQGRWLAVPLIAAAVLGSACGSSSGEDHGGTLTHGSFFVVAGSHQGFTCDKCHDPAAPSFSVALKGVDCLACHASADVTPAHASVTGFVYDTGTCIDCHKNGEAGLPANHDTDLFPITNTKHATIGCSQCHGATKKTPDLKCTPCHEQAAMATKHALIPATTRGERSGRTVTNYDYAAGSTLCLRCHAEGQVNRISAHSSVEGSLTAGKHRPFCLTCHPNLRTTTKTWAADFSSGARYCLDCHSSNNPD